MKRLIPPGQVLITTALLVCSFLTALDQMVVGTAMPTIIGSLGGIALYSWVFAAYLLTGTISMPIYGKLADLYGRKPVFIVGTGLFLLGSVLCGLAQTMEQLVLFRALQGLGSGAVLPITMTIAGDNFGLEQRARIGGLISGVWGFASIVGPAVGGLITEQASWRWIFYLNLPIGLAAVALLGWALHERVERRGHRIDFLGALLLSVGITLLLLGLMQAGRSAQGASALGRGGLLAGAVLCLAAFIWWERRAPEPLLPLDLFRSRLIASASLGGLLVGATLFGTNSFVPPFVQGVLGHSASATGLPLATMSIGWSIGSVAAGRTIVQLGYRLTGLLGGLALVVGGFGLTRLTAEASLWQVAATMTLAGIGMGLCTPAFLISVQNAVPWGQRGVVTSSNTFFRTIGGSIGVTLVGAVFNARLLGELAGLPAARGVDPNALLEPSARADLPPELLPALVHSFQQALGDAYLVGLALSLSVLAAAALLPGGRAAEHVWRAPAETGVEAG